MRNRSDVQIDFDHHRPEFSQDRNAAAKALQKCPVSWTDAHGGYWVLSKYADIAAAGKNWQTFSSGNDHGEGPLQGLNIPFVVTGAGGFIETDAPRHAVLRRQMNPWFSPAAVDRLRAVMEADVTYFIDRFIESGQADLVADLIGPFPGLVTLRMLGVPIEYYDRFADIIHRTLYVSADSPERAEVDAGMGWIASEFIGWIEERRREPQDDYLSFLAALEYEGQLLSVEEVMVEAVLVVGAGLDTTTALMGHTLRYLSHHPEVIAWLTAEPSRLGPACDEFLRVFSPVNATARTATQDAGIGDLQISAGDRVWMMWHSANLDPDVFDSPDEVRLDRARNRHVSFGAGPHRCIGAQFARVEWEIVISQVLERMPDFTVDEAALVPFPDISITAGFVAMPIRFSPGRRRGPGVMITSTPPAPTVPPAEPGAVE